MVSTLDWSPKPQDYRDFTESMVRRLLSMDKENYKSG